MMEDTTRALEWWDQLPMQNLEDPADSWVGYCMKYYPNKTSCMSLKENEITDIWQQEEQKKSQRNE